MSALSKIPITTLIKLYEERTLEDRGEKGYWFSPDSMKAFDSVLPDFGYMDTENNLYFISSEQFSKEVKRLYSIRKVKTNGAIETIGDFQRFKSESSAEKALFKHACLGEV